MRTIVLVISLLISTTIAYADNSLLIKGAAATLYYSENCTKYRIGSKALTVARMVEQNYKSEVQAELNDIRSVNDDFKTPAFWCALMNDSVRRNEILGQ